MEMYFLKQEGELPKLLSPINTDEDASLETLCARLEQLNVFKRLGPFQFWDAEEGCRIDVDFEALNSIRDCVHLIPSEDNEVAQHCKRPRVGDVVLGGESVGTAGEQLMAHAEEADLKSKEPVEMGPTFSSGVSAPEEHSMTDGPAMKSTLVSTQMCYNGT